MRGLQNRGGDVLVAQDRTHGLLDLATAAELGDAIAQRDLGQELLQRGGSKCAHTVPIFFAHQVAPSIVAAVALLARAASQGDAAAQFTLAMQLHKAGDKSEAIKWLEVRRVHPTGLA